VLTEITQDQAADLIFKNAHTITSDLFVQTVRQPEPIPVRRATPLAVKPIGWLKHDRQDGCVYNRPRDAARSMLNDIYSGRVDESVRFFVQGQ